ncbi:MAG: guanylate kinase [Niameybacter sp.]|uniref:guanylate kinase n=1 Tax=Niameybacter sp. TaxID=2033640 RepID=UPI002FC9CF73
MQSEGLKIILSGPSGSGKGTIVKELIKEDFRLSISATTRKPRIGEENEVHYFFKTVEEFEEMIEKDELLEYANFCNNYYGTPKSFIDKSVEEGKDVILEIEVQGAMQVKSVYPDAIFVFIMPPNFEELKSRLIGRATETDDVIEVRLKRAEDELQMYREYDYIVINDRLEDAVDHIKQIVQAEKLKSYRYKSYIENMLKK